MRTAMTASLALVLVVGLMLPFLTHSYPGKQLLFLLCTIYCKVVWTSQDSQSVNTLQSNLYSTCTMPKLKLEESGSGETIG